MHAYFAPVAVYSSVCCDITHLCFINKEFSKIQIELYQQALHSGFNIIPFPFTTPAACGAECLSSFLIEPSGHMQKCWNAIGIHSEAIGHLTNQEVSRKLEPNLIKWLDWDIFRENKCVKCKLLPVCMGSCLYKKLGQETGKLECPPWRYSLKDMLRLYYTGWRNVHKKD